MLLEYREALLNLVLADLKARYKYSFAGFFWSLLNPLLEVFVLLFVVGFVFRAFKTQADPYQWAAYILCGVISWHSFASSLADCADSLIQNPSIVKCIPLPRQILPLSKVLSNAIHLLLAMAVVLVVVTILLAFVGRTLALPALLLPLLLLIQLTLSYGLGLVVSTAGVFYRDTRFVVQAFLRIWYFACPIFYRYTYIAEALGDKAVFYFLNPMAGVIASYQRALVEGLFPPPFWLEFSAGLAVLSVIVGHLVFKRYEWLFAEVL